jgi:hypothetical protein
MKQRLRSRDTGTVWTSPFRLPARCAVVELIDERAEERELAREALALARRHAHPSYDVFYLVLAPRQDALWATTDEKVLAVAERIGARVEPKLIDTR